MRCVPDSTASFFAGPSRIQPRRCRVGLKIISRDSTCHRITMPPVAQCGSVEFFAERGFIKRCTFFRHGWCDACRIRRHPLSAGPSRIQPRRCRVGLKIISRDSTCHRITMSPVAQCGSVEFFAERGFIKRCTFSVTVGAMRAGFDGVFFRRPIPHPTATLPRRAKDHFP